MIEQIRAGIYARLEIAQNLALSQLGEGPTKELIPAGKAADFVASFISLDDPLEMIVRRPLPELRKNDSFGEYSACWRISCAAKTPFLR